ncbi:HAD hydrolase family protein [Patescibacteria group bacterium]|nr:HAD hydrolase family protein [Patescibacteria group bacterium]
MEKDKLILIDVDGTLTDASYQITDSGITRKIMEMQKQGWTIGLNSDTPFSRLEARARALHLNGLLICELGNSIHQINPTQLIWEERHKESFAELNERFQEAAKKSFPEIIRRENDLKFSLERFRNELLPHGSEIWILHHASRRHSFAFQLIKKTPRGDIFVDRLLIRLAECAQRLFLEIFHKEPLADVNHKYGVCILHHKDSRKSKAAAAVFAILGYEKIYMIGDSMSDFLNHPCVVQCAVGNASIEYKRECSIVAKNHLASGVIECLGQIKEMKDE